MHFSVHVLCLAIVALVTLTLVESRGLPRSSNYYNARKSVRVARREAANFQTPRMRARRQDDCSTHCGTYFENSDFATCSNIVNGILSDDPGTASKLDASEFCSKCPDTLLSAFQCISQYCSGGDPSELDPVLKVIRDSCFHVDNDRSKDYCISSWIKLERDAQEDRDSFNQNFQACSGSPSCSSDACTKVLDYLQTTTGCCYYGVTEVVSSFENGFISADFIKGCAGREGIATECTS